MLQRSFSLLILLLAFSFNVVSAAIPSDFGAKGIMLGEIPKDIEKFFGEILFDNYRLVYDYKIKYITFDHGYVVGLDNDGRVVDIIIKDYDYCARDGVRYGATSGKICKVFGKVKRQFIDGKIWYIYKKEEDDYSRLMIEVDAGNGSLISWRITSLPLSAEEADLRLGGSMAEDWISNDLNAVIMYNRDIDMSALERRK